MNIFSWKKIPCWLKNNLRFLRCNFSILDNLTNPYFNERWVFYSRGDLQLESDLDSFLWYLKLDHIQNRVLSCIDAWLWLQRRWYVAPGKVYKIIKLVHKIVICITNHKYRKNQEYDQPKVKKNKDFLIYFILW